jgi:beta-N-acetylhexosaminidase
MLPAIFSLKGQTVTPHERAVFKRANPVGFIIFGKNDHVHNIDTPEQTRALVSELKNILGRDCPILIDQEGGRVARLKPPHYPAFPTFESFGHTYTENPSRARAELAASTEQIAEILNTLGINVNCSPVADLRHIGAHDIIGDRAFSTDPDVVTDLCDVVARTYLDYGITPILKHAPGHGRALADSHLELPTVDAPRDELDRTDFKPFADLSRRPWAGHSWMMTAHILYPHIDAQNPATLSPAILQDIVRRDWGYGGIIIGDDMDMAAMHPFGDVITRSLATLAAGCDLVLNCQGRLPDMEKLADSLPKIGDTAAKKLAA